jgi:hypothetical protein
VTTFDPAAMIGLATLLMRFILVRTMGGSSIFCGRPSPCVTATTIGFLPELS